MAAKPICGCWTINNDGSSGMPCSQPAGKRTAPISETESGHLCEYHAKLWLTPPKPWGWPAVVDKDAKKKLWLVKYRQGLPRSRGTIMSTEPTAAAGTSSSQPPPTSASKVRRSLGLQTLHHVP